MKYLYFFVFCCCFGKMGAQELATGRSMGMGDLSAVFDGQDALLNNPAGLASIENPTLVAGVERRYWWANVGMAGAAAALPTSSGAFGVAVQSFGFSEFNRQKIAVSYARYLAKTIRVGGQVDYLRTAIPDYGSTGTLSFEIGLQAILSKYLTLGAHIANPHQIEIVEDEKLPAVFQLGLHYQPSKKTNIGLEIEKDIEFPLRMKCGVEYLPVEKLAIRVGMSSDPANFHFGVGLQLSEKWRFDIANRYDPTLGLASSGTLLYVF